jgi:methionine synthase I (cobalamin-dependent)
MMGVTVAEAWELARAEGASFVGGNCGVGLDRYLAVARLFAECGGELPIWIKGNAGKPELGPDGKAVYRATPEDFAAAVGPLLDAGVRFIGGCCGSTPDHIRALSRAIRGAAPSLQKP